MTNVEIACTRTLKKCKITFHQDVFTGAHTGIKFVCIKGTDKGYFYSRVRNCHKR